MKHNHQFKQIGSGCIMVESGPFPCDAYYKCECGVQFKVKTDRVGHMHLPESFIQMPRSEVKEAELDAIMRADFGDSPTVPPIITP